MSVLYTKMYAGIEKLLESEFKMIKIPRKVF